MTDKHLNQIKEQLPKGEKITKMYKALEGDVRVITTNPLGRETRYTCELDKELNVKIRRF